MLSFVEGHTLAALILMVLLMGTRMGVKNSQYRGDLRGAATYLALCLMFRSILWGLDSLELLFDANDYLVALELLLLCLGVIRALVGTVIWLFRGRRGIATPKIVRDVIDAGLYAVATVAVLRATLKVDVTSLVATSAAVSVVIGLALQETLGNLFAGLSLSLEHPFQVGDWIGAANFTGRVVQIAWRATKMDTVRHERVTIPNSQIAKTQIVNYSRHGLVGQDINIAIELGTPPNRVKSVIREVVTALPLVAHDPPPSVQVLRFDDAQVIYSIRFFARRFEDLEETLDSVLSTVWYRLKREGIDLASRKRRFGDREPARVDSSEGRVRAASPTEDKAKVDTLEMLEKVDFLRPLGPDGRTELAERVTRSLYGMGELVIRAGDPGESLYLVARGEVAVMAPIGGKSQEVARLRHGEFFGEMSLLTGEPRSATVVAATDAELVIMERAAFAQVLEHHESVGHELADILGRRRAALDKASKDADAAGAAKAESGRIFNRLRELFKIQND